MNSKERRKLRRAKEYREGEIILKNTPQQNKSDNQSQKESKSQPHKVAIRALLGLCTLLGGIVAVLALLPRPVVSSPSVPFDPRNALSVSFDISNSNFVPLRDVSAYLGLGQLVGGKGSLLSDEPPSVGYGSRFTNPEWQHHNLGMDERFTINLESMFRNMGAADIAIVVSYRPWLLPITKEKIFRFVTGKRSDGVTYWRSWPVGEKLPKF
jgi:hypothetical protein